MTIFHCSNCNHSDTEVYIVGLFKVYFEDNTSKDVSIDLSDCILSFISDDGKIYTTPLYDFVNRKYPGYSSISIIECSGFCINCMTEVYSNEK